MVSKYFSRYKAQRTSRKPVLRSASFSAMGVAESPGSRVIAAEAAVVAAVSSRTVVCFSSSAAMVPRWNSGSETIPDTTEAESSAKISEMITNSHLFLFLAFITFINGIPFFVFPTESRFQAPICTECGLHHTIPPSTCHPEADRPPSWSRCAAPRQASGRIDFSLLFCSVRHVKIRMIFENCFLFGGTRCRRSRIRTRNREQIRQALVTTALDLMARQGIQHHRGADLQSRWHLPHFFYTFFPTKEDLIVETLYLQQPKDPGFCPAADGRSGAQLAGRGLAVSPRLLLR